MNYNYSLYNVLGSFLIISLWGFGILTLHSIALKDLGHIWALWKYIPPQVYVNTKGQITNISF